MEFDYLKLNISSIQFKGEKINVKRYFALIFNEELILNYIRKVKIYFQLIYYYYLI